MGCGYSGRLALPAASGIASQGCGGSLAPPPGAMAANGAGGANRQGCTHKVCARGAWVHAGMGAGVRAGVMDRRGGQRYWLRDAKDRGGPWCRRTHGCGAASAAATVAWAWAWVG